MSKLEKLIEYDVSEYAEQLGCLTLKLNVIGRMGWPDRLYLYPGPKILFIEFKQLGEQPRAIQQHYIDAIRRFGFQVEVVDDIQQGRAIIQRFTQGDPVV